ncbi:photosynthetic reaction center subunit H [Aurantiacibacter spongiae]|uniref:Photosynthetic reaction centre H subunit N-terminal domain-containing protein n=1 Tax=Aurantiacibacter spongiae TaxID=2488860 RepID=A0A3N5CT02_9SPHN|nr:photosynthetic reaction center subunit H [Aurantiacibacter spongiae]RPF71767.1 hypothetical protein EG799_09165 [Aurantiacibacter spongiae]
MTQGLEARGAFTAGGYFSGFDLPLLLVILFFVFFLCLVYYLRREDKREGYPLVANPRDRERPRVSIEGFPAVPPPKRFIQPHGRPDVYVPRNDSPRQISGEFVGGIGGPFVPAGDPLLAGVGAGAWQERIDEPDLSFDGKPVIRPMRWGNDFRVARLDMDPRGLPLVGLDHTVAGEVVDIWFDRSEHHGRFLEVQLASDIASQRTVDDPRYIRADDEDRQGREPVAAVVTREHIETPTAVVETVEVDVLYAGTDNGSRNPADHVLDDDEMRDDDRNDDGSVDPAGSGEGNQAGVQEAIREGHDPSESKGGDEYREERLTPPPSGRILVPMEFVAIDTRNRRVRTAALTGAQLANVPGRKSDTMITALEEQLVRAYYGGGLRFATPQRAEPLL